MTENQVIKYGLEISTIFDNALDDGRRSFQLEDRNIIKISVAKDFRSNIYPVVYLQLALSDKDYYYIKENKNSVKFLVKVNSYLVDDVGTLEEFLSRKRPYMKNNIMSMMFRGYFDDVSPFTELKINEDNVLKDDSSDLKLLEMYLFSEEDLEKNKIDCNYVLNDANIFDAIIHSCNKVGITNLIMLPPDNEEEYKQIISPPVKLKQSISFLQENYGVYNNGILLFHDFNKTYIIPKYLKEAVVEKDECKSVYILLNEKDGNNANLNISSYYDSSKNIFVINTINNVTITDNSNLNKEIVGDSLNVIDISNIENKNIDLELNSYSSNSNTIKQKNLINYNNNSYIVEEYKSELQNSQININLNLINVDISYLGPNKEIVLIFENSDTENKYGGHYSINNMTYIITRESGGSQDFYVKLNLDLNKVMYV